MSMKYDPMKKFDLKFSLALYHGQTSADRTKPVACIKKDTSGVLKMTTVSDAPICGVTCDCHSDNSRGVMLLENIYGTGIIL